MRKLSVLCLALGLSASLFAQGTPVVPEPKQKTAGPSNERQISYMELGMGLIITGMVVDFAGVAAFSTVGFDTNLHYEQPELWTRLRLAGAIAPAIGTISSVSGYLIVTLLHNNAVVGSRQTILPYVALVGGGALLAWAAFSSVTESFPSRDNYLGDQSLSKEERTGLSVVGSIGIACHVGGIIFGVVHAQEMIDRARKTIGGSISGGSELPQNRTIVTPDIGIGYLGVAISMP